MFALSRCLTAALVVLVLVLFPAPARLQEQKPQQAAPQPEQTTPQQQTPEEDKGTGPGEQGQIMMPDKPAAAKPEPSTASTQKTEDTGGIYTIKQGDTLWDISNAFLKDPFLWPLLWKANPYITNPDLIYPGNKLTIPSMAPIERAMEAPGAVAEETAVEEPAPEKAPPQVAALPPKKPVTPIPAQEQEPVRPRIILPEEAAIPLMDRYAMLNAGFISDEESDDTIVGSLEPKTVFSYDDVVYIRVRSREKVNVGDKFSIFQPLRNVKHPITNSNYGTLIKVLGVLQVTKAPTRESPDLYTARVTLSFDTVEKGNLLTPYQEPSLIYESPRKKARKVDDGYILEVVDTRTLNGQLDIVYLDRGASDNVEPGDRFIVSIEPEDSDEPRKIIGEVQVFLVKENTSTAVVRRSVDSLSRGDMVELKK